MAKNKFILSGNAPYENKGCEAITRGTIKILNNHFGNDNSFVCESRFDSQESFVNQKNNEYDSNITHIKFTYADRTLIQKLTLENIIEKSLSKFKIYGFPANLSRKKSDHREFIQHLGDCTACLAVGGDNYSLDYGIPRSFTDIDDLVLHYKKPIIIWGASVGPFSKIPEYEKYMQNHLQKVTAIFAREDQTIEYLEKIGVKHNVYRFSDPAFMMDPVKPKDFANFNNLNESIGINLSPMMARFWTDGDQNLWTKFCIELVESIIRETGMPVSLISHVVDQNLNNPNNDYILLKNIKENLSQYGDMINLINPNYTAEEIKYIISNLKLFIGARTHSTIAAFSTLVPTISLAYSIKALGINKEVYGDLSYCIQKEALNNPQIIVDKINTTLADYKKIVEVMSENIIKIKERSNQAGEILKRII